ncbi:MAG: tetratricopeptide repeat protein [Verrucomicrobiales bacterium]|nr:tetratricopeptide repeat protein [Verrucomicrobiales bacterium]
MKKNWIYRSFLFAASVGMLIGAPSGNAQDEEEDVSVEALYRKAVEFNMNGNPAEASKTFERLFDLSGGKETLFEDYGAQAGGFFFDYGLTLLPQQRWADAKEAFQTCVDADDIAKKVESPINSQNPRKDLAKFQLGFCEAQLGNHGEAIRLYDEYLASNPNPDELQQVYASYKLRYGASLMKLGRVDEGIANIQELFDNRETRNISPQFLVQGMLELGLALVEQANGAGSDTAALEKVSERAHAFLDLNADSIKLSPLDQFRFGFVDRLRKLGLESTKAGLYSVALRYFAFAPTLEDVKQDINLGLARLPVGSGIPSQYQQLIDRIAEYEKAPIHPDAETLRLMSNCYEKLGNRRASRVIYWNLAEQEPEAPQELRAEILHEAARLSSQLGDYSAAQYFGEKFMSEMPEDHKLRNNVSTFMLQSLFTSREFDQVIDISNRVRERYEAGDEQRELADSLYPLALYSTQRHEEAEAPFDEYVKSYPEGGNREIVMFHRASNSLILGKMRESAEQYEDFLKAHPESERFLDNALADLAIARFNLEDYPAAIAATDRLVEARPESVQLGRTLNVAGDAYIVQAGNLGSDDAQEAQKEEWEKKSIESYLAAYEAAKSAQTSDSDRGDYHKVVAAEGIWKAADQYFEQEQPEKGIELYDTFFPDYAGTPWEPQISVFSLEYLEAADRGEEALTQVEKMILFLGNQPPEEQDLTLLRQAIGSYADASARIRGVDQTVATLEDFPGLDPENQALLTWLKIQQVIVLQEAQKKMEKDSPEFAAAEAKIENVFESLRLFEKRNLSEFALREIGRYFAGTDNPFRGVPYFEELLARTNPEADQFKGLAEMELGMIEMRAADPGKVQAARERFRRIIDKYKDAELVPDAHLNLAKLYMEQKDWRSALAELDVINKAKSMFKGERQKRAEALFLMGNVLDEMDQPAEANQAYLAVVSTYGAFPDMVTQAWEKYIPNSIEDFEKMPVATPEEQAEKRKRELALYSLTRKFIYQWQKWTDEEAPSGALRRLRRQVEDMKVDLAITPEEEQKVLFDLGIAPEA